MLCVIDKLYKYTVFSFHSIPTFTDDKECWEKFKKMG